MNWTLSDYANLAQILSIPLAIVLWFFTKEHVAKFWKTWWKPIFGVLAVVTLFALWRLGWFNWLTYSPTIPIWVLILLVFLGLLFAFVVWLLKTALNKKSLPPFQPPSAGEPERPEQPTQPDWHSFTRADIFGVVWEWNYIGNMINGSSLAAFCPNQGCMNRLEDQLDPKNPNQSTHDFYIFPVTLNCHRCRFKRHFDCDYDTLKRRVMDEIERLVKTGRYVQLLR